MAISGGLHSTPHPLVAKRHWKKSRFKGAKEKKIIAPRLFLYYELSVCPLLLNYNKVYLASSLIAKPTLHAMTEFDTHYVVKRETRLKSLSVPKGAQLLRECGSSGDSGEHWYNTKL